MAVHLKDALIALFAMGYATSAQAQHISPLIYELSPSGEETRQEVVIGNSGNSPAAFEIVVARRSYTENGEPVDVPETQALAVDPDAIWVEPGSSRKVTVRYAGTAELVQSEMYMVTFRQVPVRLAEGAGQDGIRLQYEFATIAHVVPPNVQPEIIVESLEVSGQKSNIVIRNRGRRYGRIDSGSLELRGQALCLAMSGELLADRFPSSWILPGEKRTLEVELPLACPSTGLVANWVPADGRAGK
jgi:P pilus assembly chaperone PapD